MRGVPLVKLFLLGMFAVMLGVYTYFLAMSLQPEQLGKEAQIKWLQIAVDRLNLREGPNTATKVIKSLPLGERVELLGEEENWFKIRDNAGKEGWVYRPYAVLSPPGLN